MSANDEGYVMNWDDANYTEKADKLEVGAINRYLRIPGSRHAIAALRSRAEER